MSMSEPRRQACMKIMRKLMKYPCAEFFLHPVDPNGTTDYNDIIKSPQDLTSIYKRLVDKSYPTVESWEKDLVLIWYNCEKYHGVPSFAYILAQLLKDHYKKLRDMYLTYTLPMWEDELTRLKTKIDKLISSTPIGANGKLKKKDIIEQQKDKKLMFKEDEFTVLYKNLSKMKSPADTLAFVNIFYKHEPTVPAHEDPLSVDLRTLSYDTLSELRVYAERRCKEMGIKYN